MVRGPSRCAVPVAGSLMDYTMPRADDLRATAADRLDNHRDRTASPTTGSRPACAASSLPSWARFARRSGARSGTWCTTVSSPALTSPSPRCTTVSSPALTSPSPRSSSDLADKLAEGLQAAEQGTEALKARHEWFKDLGLQGAVACRSRYSPTARKIRSVLALRNAVQCRRRSQDRGPVGASRRSRSKQALVARSFAFGCHGR